jgi:hypothetical protein
MRQFVCLRIAPAGEIKQDLTRVITLLDFEDFLLIIATTAWLSTLKIIRWFFKCIPPIWYWNQCVLEHNTEGSRKFLILQLSKGFPTSVSELRRFLVFFLVHFRSIWTLLDFEGFLLIIATTAWLSTLKIICLFFKCIPQMCTEMTSGNNSKT